MTLTVWLATKVEQEGRTPQHHLRVRKPVDLGTMFKDRVDLLSGHIVFNEVQEGSRGQGGHGTRQALGTWCAVTVPSSRCELSPSAGQLTCCSAVMRLFTAPRCTESDTIPICDLLSFIAAHTRLATCLVRAPRIHVQDIH